MLARKTQISIISLVFLMSFIASPQAMEVPTVTFEGELVELNGEKIKIKTKSGTREFIINEETIFCKSGYRVYSSNEFSSSKFANIVRKKTESGLAAEVVFDTETQLKVSFNPANLSQSMVAIFPNCLFRKHDPKVKELQYLLNKMGYKVGPEDGILGKKSQAALVDF